MFEPIPHRGTNELEVCNVQCQRNWDLTNHHDSLVLVAVGPFTPSLSSFLHHFAAVQFVLGYVLLPQIPFYVSQTFFRCTVPGLLIFVREGYESSDDLLPNHSGVNSAWRRCVQTRAPSSNRSRAVRPFELLLGLAGSAQCSTSLATTRIFSRQVNIRWFHLCPFHICDLKPQWMCRLYPVASSIPARPRIPRAVWFRGLINVALNLERLNNGPVLFHRQTIYTSFTCRWYILLFDILFRNKICSLPV